MDKLQTASGKNGQTSNCKPFEHHFTLNVCGCFCQHSKHRQHQLPNDNNPQSIDLGKESVIRLGYLPGFVHSSPPALKNVGQLNVVVLLFLLVFLQLNGTKDGVISCKNGFWAGHGSSCVQTSCPKPTSTIPFPPALLEFFSYNCCGRARPGGGGTWTRVPCCVPVLFGQARYNKLEQTKTISPPPPSFKC